MKKLSILTALVAMLFFAGCQPGGFSETNLIGKWENADKPGDFKVYTSDKVVVVPPDSANPYNNYKWGKEWYEKDRKESELVEHGNGWYMWKLNGKEIIEVGQTNSKTAITPVTLTIKTLTATEFQFERAGRTYMFKKK